MAAILRPCHANERFYNESDGHCSCFIKVLASYSELKCEMAPCLNIFTITPICTINAAVLFSGKHSAGCSERTVNVTLDGRQEVQSRVGMALPDGKGFPLLSTSNQKLHRPWRGTYTVSRFPQIHIMVHFDTINHFYEAWCGIRCSSHIFPKRPCHFYWRTFIGITWNDIQQCSVLLLKTKFTTPSVGKHNIHEQGNIRGKR